MMAAAAVVLLLCLVPGSARAAFGNFTVTSNADTGGTCPTPSTCASLRQAINSANATVNVLSEVDTIGFSSPGSTIAVSGQLPPISGPTSISGFSTRLDGAVAGAGVDGLQLSAGASASTISALTITGFKGSGIDISGADNVRLGGLNIGTTSNGDTGLGNGGNGITIHAAATGTRVGDVVSPGGNLIAGNGGDGINVDATSTPTAIFGDTIGLRNPTNVVVGNGGDGVDLTGPSNVIGDPTPGASNSIAGNGGFGVRITGPSAGGTTIKSNMIGLDIFGSRGVGNAGGGIRINDADNTVIGGSASGEGNTISANGNDAIFMSNGATGNRILGNRIGTDSDGAELRPNDGNGINVNSSPGNVIGGSAPGAGNVIASNLGNGIDLENTPSSNNVIQGNRIGTNAAGTLALPNEAGITAEGSNIIGGSGPGEGNLVSGNLREGIQVAANGTSSVLGNVVGLNAARTGAIPNGQEGIDADQVNATIGGPGGAANIVAFNLGPGIRVEQSTIVVAENSLFSNGGLGIDFDPAGVTTGTPQPLPALTAALASGGQTIVRGTVASTANSAVTLRFSSSPDCDPSGFGEGKTPLGAATVTTDAAGNASFDVTLPAATSLGQPVTATATGPAGTSEFSACRVVEAPPPAKVAPPAPLKPAVTALTQSASRWRLGSALAKLTKAKPPVGTTFSFKLNEAASVRLDFAQRTTGRRVGRRCVAQTRGNRRKPRCTRTIAAGTLSLAGHSGTNRVRFQGRLSRTKRLKPGAYTVSVTATASGLRSVSRSLTFTIVKG